MRRPTYRKRLAVLVGGVLGQRGLARSAHERGPALLAHDRQRGGILQARNRKRAIASAQSQVRNRKCAKPQSEKGPSQGPSQTRGTAKSLVEGSRDLGRKVEGRADSGERTGSKKKNLGKRESGCTASA